MGHRVTVLVLPGVLPLEFGIAVQIFGTDPHYELTVCAAGPVHGDGFCVTASAGLGALADADTVVVPGYRDIDAKPSGDVLAGLLDAHQRGARLVRGQCAGGSGGGPAGASIVAGRSGR